TPRMRPGPRRTAGPASSPWGRQRRATPTRGRADCVGAISLRRFPHPYRAALTICNDADLLTVESFRRLHRYLNTTESTPWGKGLQLPLGQSFFLFRSPESPNRFSLFDGLSSRLGRDASFMLECARGGLLDVL